MRIFILVALGAVTLAGCAADVKRNEAINHIVAKCAPGGTPLSGEVQNCMDYEAAVAVAGNYCTNWQIAPNQMERCTRDFQRYVHVFTECKAGRSLPADRPQIVACARAREPQGYAWLTKHHA